jgi:hypothetical protein
LGGSDPLFLGAGPPKNLSALPRGRSRPTCAKANRPGDLVDDIADDTDVDSGVDSELDIRVDGDAFNLVGDSRIARESATSSRCIEEETRLLVTEPR